MINELMLMDRALESTWVRYLEFLQDPELAPAQAVDFLDRLAVEPDEYLGYTNTAFPDVRTMWLLRLGRDEEAAATRIKALDYGCQRCSTNKAVTAWLEASVVVREAKARYYRRWPSHIPPYQELSTLPLTWLERGPVPVKRMWDACKPESRRKTLLKGTDAYLFRCFAAAHNEKYAASPELSDADPAMAENKRKYERDAYNLCEYRTREAQFDAPFINHFLATYSGTLDLEALLRKAATERGGDFTYKLTAGYGIGSPVLFADERNVNYCSNGDTVYLLYILKKCGYLEDIFKALPSLPEDFPLLLMCFADAGIRQRVEEYMGLPGLAAMYDLAFAARRLNVREQVRLVDFGRKNPRFQNLLGASLFRYGYHIYNQYTPKPDWFVQEFAQFSCAFCADVLLFLVSAPDALPLLRQIMEYGPGTQFEGGPMLSYGFDFCWPYFSRNILGYLALRGDSHLAAWQEAELMKSDNYAAMHRRLKTQALVDALQKLPSRA